MQPQTVEEVLANGQRYLGAGDLHNAEGHFRAVLERYPQHPDALHLLGVVTYQAGDAERALEMISRSLELAPDRLYFWLNFSEISRASGRTDAAIRGFKKAIELSPNFAGAWYGLGQAHERAGDFPDAIAAYRRSMELDANDPCPQLNLGVLIEREGQYDEARRLFERALELRPDYPHAHVALGLSMMRRGELERAWPHYEWRWRHPHFRGAGLDQEHPVWDGAHLNGKTIVVRNEQGLGDVLQFVRYLPMISARGGQLVLEAQPPLESLLRQNPSFGSIVAIGDALPIYDIQVGLLSLPGIFKTDMSNIPATVPYIEVDPLVVRRWRQRLGEPAGLRVGLVWAGNPRFPGDKRRSITLESFAPLLKIPAVAFYSLQVGSAGEQAKAPPAGANLTDLGPDLRDFTDTAAVLLQLDLLIAVDTSVVHLAGALARPVWTLIPYVPDWRWFMDREDSPWYPTMRLFRQRRLDDWSDPIERVTSALCQLVAAR